MTNWLWFAPALPLGGFLVNILFGSKLGRRGVSLVGCGVIAGAFAIAVYAFFAMRAAPQQVLTHTLFTWISVGDFNIPARLVVDPLSCLYFLIITGVGFLIHLYSVGYMWNEEGYGRYFAHLNLFIFFMLLLVLGSNMLVLFIGWEGVGLCSYLLIGHYNTRPEAAVAAKKAFVVNRIGDFGFIVASLWLFFLFGSLEFFDLNQQATAASATLGTSLSVVTMLLLLGATGKSAQIPLYVWLPDAMAGPTPVSALIHAATMVTAGIYLIARLSALFVLAPITMHVMAVLGALTALLAASIAIVQTDLKKVLAYSTVSQLGYMFMALGVGAFSAAVFHVMTHAFFKALLFLGSGSVILALHHEQDMRKMGGLIRKMPITGVTYIIGSLALAGLPLFSAGFFSKDEILWKAYSSPLGHTGLWVVGAVTAAITAFYAFRAVSCTFFGKSRLDPHHLGHVRESPWMMSGPLILLAVFSIGGGWLGIPHVLGDVIGVHHSLEGYFSGVFANVGKGRGGALDEIALMGGSSLLGLLGIGGACYLYIHRSEMALRWAKQLGLLHRLLLGKYFVDEAYSRGIVKPIEWISRRILWRVVDIRIIDGLVNGSASLVRTLGGALRLSQNGLVMHYALALLAGSVILLWLLVF